MVSSDAAAENVVELFELAIRACPHEEIVHDMIDYIGERYDEDLLVCILNL